jgi:HPt (histidine-containing phosphotransfer) domain-containing protein
MIPRAATDPDSGKPALTEALNRLWTKFLPEMDERIAVLSSAAAASTAGQLSIEQQEAARAAAHKLAGALGTFGLTEGTELAREAEILYSAQRGPNPAAARLVEIAAQLRAVIANRK